MSKPALEITRGWPGSGKSTEAQARVAANPGTVRVNRDSLRQQLFNKDGVLSPSEEESVTLVQRAMVRALLGAKTNVIVDDTNLVLKFAKDWADLAMEMGAEFKVTDFKIDLETAIKRDAERKAAGGRGVGEDVIRKIAKRFPTNKWQPVIARANAHNRADPDIVPVEPLEWNAPAAYIFDIDGTLAIMGDRGPFDFDKVGLDTPRTELIELARHLSDLNFRIIVFSGRDDSCQDATSDWLDLHGMPFDELHMRKAGDQRKDSVVKSEMFDQHVRHKMNVHGVFDDRDQVVAFWRAIGLICYQVNYGDF